jgi:hypothetical protein
VRLLTREEVTNIIVKSWDDRRYTPNYRIGQAVYNNLPIDIAQHITNTDKDMYYVKDEDLVYTMLLNLAEKM